MLSAEQLVESTVDLVTLPAVYLRARERIDDPDSSLGEVAEVIGQDPAMTARLLRIANSAFFGFAARIETVGRAVNILGTQQVHDLCLQPRAKPDTKPVSVQGTFCPSFPQQMRMSPIKFFAQKPITS